MKKYNINDIKPEKENWSDKYSWNIYKFVKKNGFVDVYYLMMTMLISRI